MKRLFLASSIDRTAGEISKYIPNFRKLKLVFINTAGEPEKGDLGWIDLDRKGLTDAGFDVTDYTVTGKTPEEIDRDLSKFDIIHVNGGNTFYLLFQSRKSGFDKWVKEAVTKGKIYTGSSAGSIIASPNIEIAQRFDKYNYKKELENFVGFNLVDFIILPHWGRTEKIDYFMVRMKDAYKEENQIILLNDRQFVRVEGQMYRIEEI